MIKGWGRPLFARSNARVHYVKPDGFAMCGRFVGGSALPAHPEVRRCASCERQLERQRRRVAREGKT